MVKLQRLIRQVTDAYERFEFHTVYHAIHQFCAVFLSQFYFDVLKDRLYIEEVTSLERRSSQTVMYEILHSLVRLIAPLIPHTSDEVWKYIPNTDTVSVQLTDLPSGELNPAYLELEKKWDSFLSVRDEVLKALEIARRDKMIGNSLEATVRLYPSEATHRLLQQMNHDLAQLFIVSHVELAQSDQSKPENVYEGQGIAVHVMPASGEKCQRCWIITPTVGKDPAHPTLCTRCSDVVKKMDREAL